MPSAKRKPKKVTPTKPPSADAMVAKVRALLARAADAGASEEERRTSAVIAAKLMREHGIAVGEPAPPPMDARPLRAAVPEVPRMLSTVVDILQDPVRGPEAVRLARELFGSLFTPRRR